jgi:hypothetical protein
VLLKTLEAVVPESLVTRDPVPHGAELIGDEVVAAFAAVALLGEEAGIEEDAEVLGDRGAAHLEVPGDRIDRPVGPGEEVEHVTPGGMADGGEDVGFAVEGDGHDRNMRKQVLTCQVAKFGL